MSKADLKRVKRQAAALTNALVDSCKKFMVSAAVESQLTHGESDAIVITALAYTIAHMSGWSQSTTPEHFRESLISTLHEKGIGEASITARQEMFDRIRKSTIRKVPK